MNGLSIHELHRKYNVSLPAIKTHCSNEEWVKKRAETSKKVVARAEEKSIEKKADRLSRIESLTDQVLDKIEQGLKTVDVRELYGHKKTEHYTEDGEKEVETVQTVSLAKTNVDLKMVKQAASALRDLKELHTLRNDIKEQDARISNLQKESEDNDNQEIKVVFEGGESFIED